MQSLEAFEMLGPDGFFFVGHGVSEVVARCMDEIDPLGDTATGRVRSARTALRAIACDRSCVSFEVVSRETLRHNPLNAVTAVVERVTDATGHTLIRKELRRPDPSSTDRTAGAWGASTDPTHWNYWRREADAYLCAELREGLQRAGLDMAAAEVEETDAGVVLWLEDVAGTPGTEFSLDDHVAVAAALGRWHAQGALTQAWVSRRFLRDYSASKPARYELVEDDAAWGQPLIANCWPAGLRDGWRRLLANRETLLTVMESLPRTRSHLDVWVSNEVRRPTGPVVLLDWAFAGDGAVGEDLGNHIPDAVFDLFWQAERIAELDETCSDAYLRGLHEAGWHGDERDVRLGVVASCVKYVWLLPRLLESANAASHQAYHQIADSHHLYQQRGAALMHLVAWCDEALRLAMA
jgi:hypothetical protein